MLRVVWVLVCILYMTTVGWSQAIGSNSSQILLDTPPPPSVYTVTGQTIGNRGLATYYYWVVANYPIGKAFPGGPAIITFAPDVLSVTNYVQVQWNPVDGAISYDVLRTSVAGMPNGIGNYAVATTVLGTSVNDQSNTLTSYIVSSTNKTSSFMRLNNKDYSMPFIDTLDWRMRSLWFPTLTPSRALRLNANGMVESATGVLTDCIKVDGSSGVCGGGSITIEDNGVVVGSRSIFNYLPGAGIINNLSDTGTKIGIQQVVNPATIAYRSNVQSGASVTCVSASGSGVTYTCGLTPILLAYTNNMVVQWVPDVNGTGGATTINISGVGAAPIKQADGVTNPSATDIVANTQYPIWFDGVNFRLPKVSGTAGSSYGTIQLGPNGGNNATPLYLPFYSEAAFSLGVTGVQAGVGTVLRFAATGCPACTSFTTVEFTVPYDANCVAGGWTINMDVSDPAFAGGTVIMGAGISFPAATYAEGTPLAYGGGITNSAALTLVAVTFQRITIASIGETGTCEVGRLAQVKIPRVGGTGAGTISVKNVSLRYTK